MELAPGRDRPSTVASGDQAPLAVAAVALLAVACQQPTGQPLPSAAATSAIPLPPSAQPAHSALTTTASSPIDGRYVGIWHGAGRADVAKLSLPGNQGMQLAWVQDKGTMFAGPITVALDVAGDGSLRGSVSGSLGGLRVAGNWDGKGELHAALIAAKEGPDAFNGVLSVAVGTPDGAYGKLRAVSSDGRWIREALVKLSPPNAAP